MTTIQIEAEISTEQLLRVVEQLPPQEFTSFVTHLLALRAQRQEPSLSQVETSVLLQNNQRLPSGRQRSFDDVVAQRQAETITPDELAELVQITDEIEHQVAQRLAALAALARLRRVPLATLMADLGITRPSYA